MTSTDPYTVTWFRDLAGGKLSHFIGFDPGNTGLAPQDVEALVLRLYCHFLIDHAPDSALPELCENVAEMYDYYSTPGLPAGLTAFSTEARTLPALPGRTYTRPDFKLADE